MNELVESILRGIENLIRGGNSIKVETEKELLIERGVRLLEWSSTKEIRSAEKSEKDVFIALAVKLYNKVRTLTAEPYREIRTLLKAGATWLLNRYSESTPSGLCTIIKLFSRCGQDLQEFIRTKPYSVGCLIQSIILWGKLNLETVAEKLPPIDFIELKTSVFNSYLEKAKISSISLNENDIKDTSASLILASELSQALPQCLKLNVVNGSLSIGSKLTESGRHLESIHIFNIALQNIESLIASNLILKSGQESRVSNADTIQLKKTKVRTLLALTNSYIETNQCDKALMHIHELDSFASDLGVLTEEIKQAVAFSKFLAHAKQTDLVSAESALINLLNITSSHFIALSSVVVYLNKCDTMECAHSSAIEPFNLLYSKFPNDPEFTMTKISQVRHLLAHSAVHHVTEAKFPAIITDNLGKEIGISPIQQAYNMCTEIILDNIRKIHILDRDSITQLRNILFHAISVNRVKGDYGWVVSWCSLAIQLLDYEQHLTSNDVATNSQSDFSILNESTNLDLRISVTIHKADALALMNRQDEALKLSISATKLSKSIRTLLCTFKLCLRVQGSKAAAELLLQLLKHPTDSKRNLITCIAEESDILLKSCQILGNDQTACSDKSPNQRILACIMLLSEWLNLCKSHQLWRISAESSSLQAADLNPTQSDEERSYFHITKQVCFAWLGLNLKRHEGNGPPNMASKQAESKDDLNENKISNVAQLKFASTSTQTTQDTLKRKQMSDENCSLPDQKQIESVGTEISGSSKPEKPIKHTSDQSHSENQAIGRIDGVELKPNKKSVDTVEAEDLLHLTQLRHNQHIGGFSKVAKKMKTPNTKHDEPQHIDVPLLLTSIQQTADSSNVNMSALSSRISNSEIEAFNQSASETLSVCTEQEIGVHSLFSSEKRYLFSCTIQELEENILSKLKSVLETIETVVVDCLEVSVLGPFKILENLAEMAWNISTLLITKGLCLFYGDDSQDANTIQDNAMRISMAAKCFELAGSLYSNVPYEDVTISMLNRSLPLINATSARLDLDSILFNKMQQKSCIIGAALTGDCFTNLNFTKPLQAGHFEFDGDKEVLLNLSQTEKNMLQVDSILCEFEVEKSKMNAMSTNISQLESIKHLIFMYQFAFACKRGSSAVDIFIRSRKDDIMLLSAATVFELSNIVSRERYGSINATRNITVIAQQLISRDFNPDRALLGSIFHRLIECSPSHAVALSYVEEFEQLLVSCRAVQSQMVDDTTSTSSSTIRQLEKYNTFNQEDVDRVAIRAYNCGVTQAEIGDLNLAEKLVFKALSLMRYVSVSVTPLTTSMQDTYGCILEKKELKRVRCTQAATIAKHGLGPALDLALSTDFVDNVGTNLGSPLESGTAVGTHRMHRQTQDPILNISNLV